MESQTNHPTFVRVFFLVHLMFLLIHWNACIYFLISRLEGFGLNDWVYPELKGQHSDLLQQYVRSFYWSTLTLTAIGDLQDPSTNLECSYTVACYLTGVVMFAMIVGNAGSIILNRNASRLDFEKHREITKQYMKSHAVPKELQKRVVMWYDYSWARGRITGVGDINTLKVLPNKMKTEIALHVNLDTLKKVTFLQKCQPEFLHELVLRMKAHIFTPGDLICRVGEVAKEMFVISHGKIEILGEYGQVLKVLAAGDFFGEIGILNLSEGLNRRTADVRSIGFVECFLLTKEDVAAAVRDYPEAQAYLLKYGRKRILNTSKDPRFVHDSDEDNDYEESIDVPPMQKEKSSRALNNNNNKTFVSNGSTDREFDSTERKSPAYLTPDMSIPGSITSPQANRRHSYGRSDEDVSANFNKESVKNRGSDLQRRMSNEVSLLKQENKALREDNESLKFQARNVKETETFKWKSVIQEMNDDLFHKDLRIEELIAKLEDTEHEVTLLRARLREPGQSRPNTASSRSTVSRRSSSIRAKENDLYEDSAC